MQHDAMLLRLGPRILFIGAHADDIELGCGALINRLARHPEVEKAYLILAVREENTGEPFEDTLSHQREAMRMLNVPQDNLTVHKFRARFLPNYIDDVRLAMEATGRAFRPDMVFTHSAVDTHQDHRAVADAALTAFRGVTLIEYEQAGGGLANPNLYAEVDGTDVEAKAKAASCFRHEAHKSYFAADLLAALARVRGEESRRFQMAEAYSIRAMGLRL